MDNNKTKVVTLGRVKLVYPDRFDNQYAGVSSDGMYNMSVPTEDLCISVELTTTDKGRTIFTTNNSKTIQINTNNSNSGDINFIGGKSDNTTGNQPYLTSSYTDFTSSRDADNEALGITSIDIEFNSSNTPMVNINFVDIRGAAIFQNGAESKYGVLFKLPYPIFQLTIKGFYGKPVTYCLHMLKCNSKFNSQTGNFEINTQFVGYTYALFSDMIIGYLKAAQETPEGQDLLKNTYNKGNNTDPNRILSINEYITKVAQIDEEVKKYTSADKNDSVKSLDGLPVLKDNLNNILTTITNTINGFNGIKDIKIACETNAANSLIIALENPPKTNNQNTQLLFNETIPTQTINSKTLNELVDNFNTEIQRLIDIYNENIVTYKLDNQFKFNKDLKLNITTISSSGLTSNDSTTNNLIANNYNIGLLNINEINSIKTRFNNVSQNISNSIIVSYYDFNNLKNSATQLLVDLDIKNNTLLTTINDNVVNNIQKKLGMPTDIRSIFKIFTTAAEIFLTQLVNVGQKSTNGDSSITRAKEFEKIGQKNLDININDFNKKNIYPWPEYNEDGVEIYLGSTTLDHNKVPELKFVDELYEGMLKSAQIAKDAMALVDNTKPLWYSVNPLDSSLNYAGFNTNNEKNPYERLPSSANQDDIARLALLRGIAFMGFSNSYLSSDEIVNFAVKEGELITQKFSDNPNILKAFNQTYNQAASFNHVKGVVDGTTKDIIEVPSDGTPVKYTYIINDTDEALLPVKSPFTNNTFAQFAANPSILDNALGHNIPNDQVVASGNFISIIPSNVYDNGNNVISPSILFDKIKNSFSGEADKIANQLLDAKFLANSGKYGVQEFTTIDYNGYYGQSTETKNIPFYSLFYSDSVAKDNPEYTYTTALAENKTYQTIWDIEQNNVDPLILLPENKNILDNSFNNEIFTAAGTNQNNKKNIGKNIELFITNQTSNLNYPFVNFGYMKTSYKEIAISLFGSRFYNAQILPETKALLFLHTLPWRGLTIPDINAGIFSDNSIINTFKFRSGFIQVPKLFPAFLGGLLWRYSQTKDPIKWVGDGGAEDYLIPSLFKFPNLNQYLKVKFGKIHSMSFDHGGTDTYVNIENELLNLPKSAKDVLINEFNQFVNGNFHIIRQNFEIFPYNSNTGNYLTGDTSWVNTFKSLVDSSTVIQKSYKYAKTNSQINLSNITGKLKFSNGPETFSNITFLNSFDLFSFGTIINDGTKSNNYMSPNYYIRYKDGSQQSEYLKKLMLDYVYISNNSNLIWNFETKTTTNQFTTEVITNPSYTINHLSFKPITISNTNYNAYFKNITVKVSDTVKANESEKAAIGDKTILNIKFETYRNLKKIYEKWVTDVSKGSNGVIFQCCTKSKITGTPDKLTTTQGPALIDTFRFVDRAFSDIGDKFNVNPFIINKLLLDNTNISLYNLFGRILTDNHFDFVPLPNFIDYNKEGELEKIFEPIPYYKLKDIAPTGPAFICVYVGQNSTKLDFGPNYAYPNDGFDLTNPPTIPPDFSLSGNSNEDIGAAFVVKYGQQNQNIFKDIILDQAEFGETVESLQITDNIANGTLNSTLNYVGQNLFNVYSVRSYKVEVEMLGNAMIQPMMYFQLDNIPMFHGAYLITKVKHNIKPNYMSTVFTGTRVKYNRTPIIDSASLYGDILATYGITGNFTTTGGFGNYVDKYFGILNANLPKDASGKAIKTIEGSNLSGKIITETSENQLRVFSINGTENGPYKNETEMVSTIDTYFNNTGNKGYNGKSLGRYTPENATTNHWSAVFISYIMFSEDTTFPVNASHYGYVSDAMNGKSGYEVFPLHSGLSIKAEVGDILTFSRSGNFATSHSNVIYKINGNTAYLVGGNVSGSKDNPSTGTVGIRPIILDNGYFTDNVKFSNGLNYKLLTKKTGNKYYNKAVLSTFPIDSIVSSNGSYHGRKTELKNKITNSIMTETYRNTINEVASKLGISTGIKQLMEASSYAEGFADKTTIPYRCSNPGSVNKQKTDIGCKSQKASINNTYADFGNDLNAGISAQYSRVYGLILKNKANSYPKGANTTLYEFFSIYAPEDDPRAVNNPSWYTNIVLDYLKLSFGLEILPNKSPITYQTTIGEFDTIK